jgi:erythronate-4-phosphate dehydrogenase
MKIVIDANIPFIRGVFEKVAEVHYFPSQNIFHQTVADADALIVRTRTVCNEQLLANSKVRFIATATAGSEHIDFDFCRKNGIEVAVAFGCNARAVAQYIGSAVSLWLKKNNSQQKKLTIGIVGCGYVGKEVEKIAKLLNFDVLLNDPPLQKLTNSNKFVDWQTIAENADIITFHTPLTFGGEFPTKNLANRVFFEKLKHNPLIINAARGGVVDENDLLKAYENGKVADFVLDCWQNEPQIAHKMVQNAFIATPHIAGYSANGKAKATKMSVLSVAKFFNLDLHNFDINLTKNNMQLSENKNITDCFLQNYNIENDSEKLKFEPEKFEFFRNNYPERREVDF